MKYRLISLGVSISIILFILYKYGFLVVLFLSTPSKKFPYSQKEALFLDSIRIINKYARVERSTIYYASTSLLDFKSNFIIDIEIRKNKEIINFQKLKNNSKIIAYYAYKKFNYDDSKTNNFIIKYNIVKDLPITDSLVLENNLNKYYFPNEKDTTVVYTFLKSNLKKPDSANL